MATVASPASTPRLFLSDGPFVLTRLEVEFTAGTGSATLGLWVDDARGPFFDRLKYEFLAAGTDGVNVFFRLEDGNQERKAFTLNAGDVYVPVWENPDDGTMEWLMTAELERA